MEQLDLKNVEITQSMKKELDNFYGEKENRICVLKGVNLCF